MRLHQGVCTGLQSSGVLTGAGGSTSKVTESHGCGQEANRSHLSLCTWLPEWHLASPKSVVQEKNQGRSHSLFNIPALKVTSYHSAMLSWSHRPVLIQCVRGPTARHESQEAGGPGGPSWRLATAYREYQSEPGQVGSIPGGCPWAPHIYK